MRDRLHSSATLISLTLLLPSSCSQQSGPQWWHVLIDGKHTNPLPPSPKKKHTHPLYNARVLAAQWSGCTDCFAPAGVRHATLTQPADFAVASDPGNFKQNWVSLQQAIMNTPGWKNGVLQGALPSAAALRKLQLLFARRLVLAKLVSFHAAHQSKRSPTICLGNFIMNYRHDVQRQKRCG